MKRTLIILATLALAGTAAAAQAPVKQADGPPQAGLTINDCLMILNGLTKLDEQRDVVVNRGKPNEQVVKEYYDFPAGVQLDVSHNIALLTAVQREAQPTQQRIFYQIVRATPATPSTKPGEPPVPASSITPGSPQEEEFNAKMRELTDKPCSAQLARLRASDLLADGKNKIPTGTLALIDKILDR